jgi:hypothetical protein
VASTVAALRNGRGRPGSDPAQASSPDLAEIGVSGTRVLAGLVWEETNPRLQGQRAFATWTAMRFDPSGSALHKVYDFPIRSARWFVEPASDAPAHIRQADFVHDNLWDFGSMSFDDVLRLADLSLIYGFTPLEIVYRPMLEGAWTGKVGWDKFAWRNPATKWRWELAEVEGRRELAGMTQKAPPTYEDIFIPRDKLLLFVNDLEGENYDGWSMFRPCFKPWFYRDQLYRIEAVGLERAYAGVPRATLPNQFSPALRDLARKIVTTLRNDEQAGIVHPAELGVDVIFNQLQGSAMRDAIAHHTRQFYLAGLAHMLDLGGGQTGSWALSSDQSELVQMAINAPANRLAEVLNLNPGIPQLVRFNFPDFDSTMLPRLAHGDIGQRNMDRLGRVLAALAQFGFLTPDDETEDQLRRQLDLPERNQDYQDRDLWSLVQEVQPILKEWKATRPEGTRLRPTTLAVPGQAAVPGQRTPVGQGPEPGAGSAAAMAEQRQAAALAFRLRQLHSRWDRPHGRPTPEQRGAMRNAELLAEVLADYGSQVGAVPERPSARAWRQRRPYQVRGASLPALREQGDYVEAFSEKEASDLSSLSADASPRERANAIRRAAKEGKLKPNPEGAKKALTTSPQRAVATRHVPAVRQALRPGKAD